MLSKSSHYCWESIKFVASRLPSRSPGNKFPRYFEKKCGECCILPCGLFFVLPFDLVGFLLSKYFYPHSHPLQRPCFNEKITLIFYKRMRIELIIYLLRLYVCLLFPICSRNSVLISLYSVEFLHFLQITLLHWIYCNFYLFICLPVFSRRCI